MPIAPSLWRKKEVQRRAARPRALRWPLRRLAVEWLEDRILLSGDPLTAATPLSFTPFQTVQVSHFLAGPRGFDLYRVNLNAGDQVTASVQAQSAGSGLGSLLRVFDEQGTPLALDDQEGGDPSLTFQAPAAGDYFVGVSSAPDDNYDPHVADSGTPGATTGLYTLDLRLSAGAPLQADLTGSLFRLGADTAAWGDSVPVTFAVENRGGAPAAAFSVDLLLSDSNTLFTTSASAALYQFPQTFSAAGLAPGQAFASPAGLTLTLPDAATAQALGFPASGPLYLGLLIFPTGPDAGVFDKFGVHRGEDWETLTLITPASADGTNHALGDAQVIDANARVAGTLDGSAGDYYQISVASTGQLTARVAAAGNGFAPRLTLSAITGQVLATSDSGAVVQNLTPGTYVVAVSARAGAGAYRLTTAFVPGSSALDPIPVGSKPLGVAVADVNGDGTPDIVTADYGGDTVSVLLGNGDGSFQAQRTFAVGAGPDAVAVADVNGDGKPDLLIANKGGDTVSVLLGNGDGSFGPQQTFAVGGLPSSVAVADLNGDGIPDLVVANSQDSTVSVLLGNGDGSFGPQQALAVGTQPVAVAVADVNGDGIPDLLTADAGSNAVSVLLGNGDGSFQSQTTVAVGSDPRGVAVADLTGDGKEDLVVANYGDNTISVLLGNGDGTFQTGKACATGSEPTTVVVADVNNDGKPDVVTANRTDDTLSVLLGNGDGTFQSQNTFTVGSYSQSVAVADLSGDGKADMVVANSGDNTLSVLLGNGDGSFQTRKTIATGPTPYAVTVADINGDGKPDIITANYDDSGTVSVLLGNGDGTFQSQNTFNVGSGPKAVAVKDLNGDGKPDLVVANSLDDTVSVLLGDGDGSFQAPKTYKVGSSPQGVAVADLRGDGKEDLIVANYGSDDVSVLLGNGDGSFQPAQNFAVGSEPSSVAVADLRGDGKEDLIVANYGSDDVSVLLGNGDGSFQPAQNFQVGSEPVSVTVADLRGHGNQDLVVTNYSDATVSVLLGDGNGSFQPQETFHVGSGPRSVAVSDVDGDHKPDLIVANSGDETVSVLLGNGDGSFQPQQTFPVGSDPRSVAAADVNGDGKPDIVVANYGDNTVSVLLDNADGSFTPSTPATGVGLRNTPYLTDLTGDGIADSAILDRSGNILFRQGLPNGQFAAPPRQPPNAGRPARDLTVLRTPSGWALATADARFDPALGGYSVSLYAYGPDGAFQRTTAFSTPFLPTRITAADLGNGRDDLLVADALDNRVQVAFQQPDGTFSAPITLATGEAPSDLAAVDINGDGRPDIVVSNQAGGTVSAFLNQGDDTFTGPFTFRAGPGPYSLDTSAATPVVNSLEESVALAAGDFTGSGRTDLVVVNRGAHSFSVLPNDGQGGLTDPQTALTTSTSDGLAVNEQPGPVVAGDFNRDGRTDLAILMEDRGEVWVYTNEGGAFRHTFSIPVGGLATGLSVVPGGGPGLLDLLVGNQYGDILHLVGKGDGTFQLAGSHTSLSVQPNLFGPGQPGVLVGNQAADHITVQPPTGFAQATAVATLPDGTPLPAFAPGSVQWAQLDGSSPYAMVAESGANQVQVARFKGMQGGVPVFDKPQTFFVGTDPVSITMQDVKTGPGDDGAPDLLVADQGSNDVAIISGSYDTSGAWMGNPNVLRLQTGGSGPVDVTVRDNGPQKPPDLVVTNGASGTMTLLPGVGQGFFNDQDPGTLVDLGTSVVGAPVFTGPAAGVAVAADGRLVGFDLSAGTGGNTVFPPPAGEGVAAVALMGNNLVVAEQDGGVQELRLSADQATYQPVESFTSLTGIPSDPSALAVLNNEVLVTNQGSDQLYVFGVAPPASASGSAIPSVIIGLPTDIALPALTVSANPVAQTSAPAGSPAAGSPLGDVPLAVVVTLVADVLPGGEAAAAEGDTGPAATGFNPTSAVTVVDAAGDEGDAAMLPGNVPPDGGDFRMGLDAILQQFNLYRPTDEDTPAGPLFLGQAPEVLRSGERVLADCWRALGEGLTPAADALGLRPELLGAAPPPAAVEVVDWAHAGWATEPAAVVTGMVPAAPAETAYGNGPHLVGPASGQPALIAPAPGQLMLVAVSGGTDRPAAPLPARSSPDWRESLLAAVAAGGLVCWAEHWTRRRPTDRPRRAAHHREP